MADEILDQNNQQLSADGILDILNAEDGDGETKPKAPAKNSKSDDESDKQDESEDESIKLEDDADEDGDEDKEEDDKEDDDDDESGDDEKIELKDEGDDEGYLPVPRRAEILKAYPDLFKKFPGMEKAIYREQQYAEVFPTISDAKGAQQTLERFGKLENDLFNGDILPTLRALKGAQPGAYGKIADNILETLAEVDGPSYNKLLERVVRTTLHNAHKTGKANNNDQLELAAEILSAWVFNDKEVKPFVKENGNANEDPREIELRNKQIQFARERLDAAVGEIGTRTQNIIKNSVDKNLDPKGLMTSYVRNKAMNDVLEQVNDTIKADTRFQSVIDRLYRASASENYSESSKKKIRDAFLGKAQSVLPGIIRKVTGEALKGSSARVKTKLKDDNGRVRVKVPSKEVGKPTARMSTFDFLNQD